MKRYQIFLKYFSIFLVFLIGLIFCFSLSRGDTFANYGFSYALWMREIPYVDFNMVIPPFSPFFYSLGLWIHPSILTIYIEQALLLTGFFFLMEKMIGKKVFLFFTVLFLMWPISFCTVLFPGYNFICVFLLFLLIYLEEKNAPDLWMGILLGILICTKQTVGVFLFLPTLLYWKNPKRIGKRIVGTFIPVSILCIYLFITKSFSSFIDLCFLGLFQFGSQNHGFSLFYFIMFLLGFLYLVFCIFQNPKNRSLYYFLCFFIVAVPILDYYHVSLFLLGPLFIWIQSLSIKDSTYKTIGAFGVLFYVLGGVMTVSFLYKPVVAFYSNFPFYVVSSSYDQDVRDLNQYLKDSPYEKIFLLMGSENYMFKIMNHEKITYYDLPNSGNYGVHGEEKMIQKIESLHNVLFIVDRELCKDTNSSQQYICSFKESALKNSEMIQSFGHFQVYYRK